MRSGVRRALVVTAVVGAVLAATTPANANTFATGSLYHAVRTANGSWTALGQLGLSGSVESITGMPDDSSQVVAIGTDGNLYHQIRFANGGWSGWTGVPPGHSNAATSTAIAGLPNGDAIVAAVPTNDPHLYVNVRHANGSWDGWGTYGGVPLSPQNLTTSVTSVSITGMRDGSAQLVMIGNDDNVYHAVRAANGTLSAMNLMGGYGGASTFTAGDVSIAGMPDGSAQVVAVDPHGNAYVNVRHANATWSGWQPFPGGNQVFSAAITGMPDGSAQIAITTWNHYLYFAIRYPNGTWSGWQAPQPNTYQPGYGYHNVSIGALPDGSSQLVTAIAYDG